MAATTTSTDAVSATQSLTGCVKWFNNGLNYGFITVLTDGEYRNTDIFVHQSNIRTARDCFRTLYTGECVQFELAKSDNEKHPVHAVNVHGFNSVPLRCEVPRGAGFRGGRGNGARGRGGYGGRGRGNFRGNRHQSENAVSTSAPASASAPQETTATATGNASAPTNVEAAAPVSTPQTGGDSSNSKGRGRGRGRKVNA
jgi:cold shock CspA family protein